MFHVVLWALVLALLQTTCEGSTMGAVVHVVPLDSSQGQYVVAHFTVAAPHPCPDLSGVCEVGEICTVHRTSLLLSGALPSPGWCVRQWHKTVPSHYNATITLGSSVTFYVSVKATPTVRPNNGRLNQPPYVALPPPLRARKNCPHHFHLDVKDLDGDKVRCRFASLGECLSCAQYTFIELDEERCMVTFTGDAPKGNYSLVVMVEDYYPAPKTYVLMNTQALSSVPVHMSLTVEESSTACSAEPVASAQTPRDNAVLYILPYEQMDLTISFTSQLETESVSEIAVVGPPALFRSDLSTAGSMASMNLSWVRGSNSLKTLAPLLSICFSANTNSLQSEPRCLWLYQRQAETLPAGTVLTCEGTEMTLVLPLSSLPNISLSELQLNSASCPVTYNSTHLTAVIPLTGCGTKTVHSGNELIYTNTLKSVRAFTMVSRLPKLVLPLACRIPKLVAHGPNFNVTNPTDREVFGEFDFTMEFLFPETRRLRRDTQQPSQVGRVLRVQRDVSSSSGSGNGTTTTSSPTAAVAVGNSTTNSPTAAVAVGNATTSSPTTAVAVENATTSSQQGAEGTKVDFLELHLKTNCSMDRVELLVEKCTEAETEDMANSHVLMDQGCSANDSNRGGGLTLISSSRTSKVYKLDLSTIQTGGSMMFVECTVYLCIAIMPSVYCSEQRCDRSSSVRDRYNTSHTFRSRAVSLVFTTPAPTTVATTVPANDAALPAAPAATTVSGSTAAATTVSGSTAAATTVSGSTATATTVSTFTATATTVSTSTATATTVSTSTATATTVSTSTATATTVSGSTAAVTAEAAALHAPQVVFNITAGVLLVAICIFLN